MENNFEITNIEFIPCKPQGTFQGFVNLKLYGWIELNSIGIHKNPDGSVKITTPARRLRNDSLKFYFNFTDPTKKKELVLAIEKAIEQTGIWSVKTKDEKETG